MNAHRTIRTVAAVVGACVGFLFTYKVVTDLRAAVDEGGVGIPGITNILVCWPVLLALLIPASLPQSLFYGILALLNGLTYAFMFWIVACILGPVFFRGSAVTEVQQ